MPILSLREYIELQIGEKFKAYDLEELLNNHIDISAEVLQKIKPLKYFKEYLKFGAYPFVMEGSKSYHQRLVEIVNETLFFDIATIYKISFSKIESLQKLLLVICRSNPYEINYEAISKLIGISKNTLKSYLLYLNKGSLINTIDGISRGNTFIQKPSKVYLNNTNLFEILCANSEIGTIRETFFVSQLQQAYNLHYPKKGDFSVNEKYLFEIGGKSKGFKQIKDLPKSYIVADDIEIGFGNKIPLWLFGFLY